MHQSVHGVIVSLSLVVVVCVNAQTSADTCSVGRVSLAGLPRTSYVVGAEAYTLGFCTAGHPSSSQLAPCPTPGFVSVHNLGTGQCTNSYDTIVQGLTIGPTGVFYVVSQSANPNFRANVSITCQRDGASNQASLVQPIVSTVSGASTTILLRILSYAGCNVDSFFCSESIACSSSADTCVNGVCIETSCARISTTSWSTKRPANFVAKLVAQDCGGNPLVNLTASDFFVWVDGLRTTDPRIAGEVATAVRSTQSSIVPQLTTLVFDQSRSVQNTYQSVLIQGALSFVETAMMSSNHYIALIAFDGGSRATVLLPHSNVKTTVVAAINALTSRPDLGDRDATNLYGAVINGLRESFQMKYSFGNLSDKVPSSMIFFTDGFDTARRETRQNALSVALSLAPSVKIIAFGVANVSDTEFLSAIASSGSFTSVTVTSLVTAFSDVATQLNLLASNNYYIGLCVPMRGSTIPVTLSLNTTRFPGSNALQFFFDASNFTSGCSEAALESDIQQQEANRDNSATVQTIAIPSTTAVTLAPRAAVFLRATVSSLALPVRITVSPITTVLYLRGSRCLLSPYCSDGSFNSSLVVTEATTLSLMIPSTSDATTSVTISTTATFVPSPTGPGTSPGATPTPTVNLSTSNERFPGGDVDDTGAIIFIVFGLIFFVIILAVIFTTACWQHVPRSEGLRSEYHSPISFSRSLQKPLMPSPHGTHASLMPPMLLSGMSPPRKMMEVHSVFTETNPYRNNMFFSDRHSIMLSPGGNGSGVGDPRFTPSRTALADNL